MNVDDLDRPGAWGTGLGFDYEFDATTSSLPSGWAWVNQSTATYAEANGAGVIHLPNGASTSYRGITRSLSGAPATYDAYLKTFMAAREINFRGTALVLRESSSGKLVVFALAHVNAQLQTACDKYTNPTTYAGTSFGVNLNMGGEPKYLRIRKNSTSSYDFMVSPDGRAWFIHTAAGDVGAFMTPDEIGWMGDCEGNTSDAEMSAEWFRLR